MPQYIGEIFGIISVTITAYFAWRQMRDKGRIDELSKYRSELRGDNATLRERVHQAELALKALNRKVMILETQTLHVRLVLGIIADRLRALRNALPEDPARAEQILGEVEQQINVLASQLEEDAHRGE